MGLPKQQLRTLQYPLAVTHERNLTLHLGKDTVQSNRDGNTETGN